MTINIHSGRPMTLIDQRDGIGLYKDDTGYFKCPVRDICKPSNVIEKRKVFGEQDVLAITAPKRAVPISIPDRGTARQAEYINSTVNSCGGFLQGQITITPNQSFLGRLFGVSV